MVLKEKVSFRVRKLSPLLIKIKKVKDSINYVYEDKRNVLSTNFQTR